MEVSSDLTASFVHVPSNKELRQQALAEDVVPTKSQLTSRAQVKKVSNVGKQVLNKNPGEGHSLANRVTIQEEGSLCDSVTVTTLAGMAFLLFGYAVKVAVTSFISYVGPLA
ncbi:MAG: hypothetical protein PVI40_02680 [Chlamydiota bacterium]|jgi:hypothetical protein